MARNSNISLNLYSFQDIVTATIGILLIVVLLLVVTITTSRIQEARVQQEVATAQRQESLANQEANAEFYALRKELEAKQQSALALRNEYLKTRAKLAGYVNAEVISQREEQYLASKPTLKIELPRGYERAEDPLILIQEKELYSVNKNGGIKKVYDNTDEHLVSKIHNEAIREHGGRALLLITPESANATNLSLRNNTAMIASDPRGHDLNTITAAERLIIHSTSWPGLSFDIIPNSERYILAD